MRVGVAPAGLALLVSVWAPCSAGATTTTATAPKAQVDGPEFEVRVGVAAAIEGVDTTVVADLSEGCCASLTTRVAELERRLAALEQSGAPRPQAQGDACGSGSAPVATSDPPSAGHIQGLPDYYKLKDKSPEKIMLNMWSWFYISFEVFAGDVYLGEFRQSMPWARLFWDEICFYDKTGDFVGQLHFGLVRWMFSVIPNPFLGERKGYLRLANGSVPLTGSKESLFKAMFSAERRSFDFRWHPTDVVFKSRKTVEVHGQQEWVIEEASGRGRAALIQESIVHDMWSRQFRGWTVSVLPGKLEILDPIVPGFFAAFDLAEHEDRIPIMIWSTLTAVLGGMIFLWDLPPIAQNMLTVLPAMG